MRVVLLGVGICESLKYIFIDDCLSTNIQERCQNSEFLQTIHGLGRETTDIQEDSFLSSESR